jgi:hypothetical protein
MGGRRREEDEGWNMQGQCVYEVAVLSDNYLTVTETTTLERQSSHPAVYTKLGKRATCQ